jgi:hypothetical protein
VLAQKNNRPSRLGPLDQASLSVRVAALLSVQSTLVRIASSAAEFLIGCRRTR